MRHTRRDAVGTLLAGLAAASARAEEPAAANFWAATFSCDVTVPLGHPLMGGGIEPAKEILDPLLARGIILGGDNFEPVVVCGFDWCEIRNMAHDRMRVALSSAVETSPNRVLVSSLHQHDAPVVDLRAQLLLEKRALEGRICDLKFHEQTARQVTRAARAALADRHRVTHYGTGQAPVELVASNRRFTDSTGRLRFDRTSSTRDPEAHQADVGNIDPMLKTLSFWDGERPLAAISHYATHPMAFYGKGGVSSDFVGLARRRRQEDNPDVFQMYLSGCSGNVTAGKHNDGSPANRAILADRIYNAMVAAWEATERRPLEKVEFRAEKMRLEPRSSEGFSVPELKAKLVPGVKPLEQCLAALGLAWRERADAGYRIDVPAIDFGDAVLLLLPGESYVEFQQMAQAARPDQFVVAVGYGECATGYVPIEQAWQEGDTNLRDWCWVAPGAEAAMRSSIYSVLKAK